MRYPLALAAVLAACAADPVLLPDSGPCSSACGAGTVCQGGACVVVDSGSPTDTDSDAGSDGGNPMDTGAVGADTGPDAPAVIDQGTTADTPDIGADAGLDSGPADTGVDAPPPPPPDGSYAWDVACDRCGVAHATCTCASGRVVYTCLPGYSECDGDARNGCEVHSSDDTANCGACGHRCATRFQCIDGICHS